MSDSISSATLSRHHGNCLKMPSREQIERINGINPRQAAKRKDPYNQPLQPVTVESSSEVLEGTEHDEFVKASLNQALRNQLEIILSHQQATMRAEGINHREEIKALETLTKSINNLSLKPSKEVAGKIEPKSLEDTLRDLEGLGENEMINHYLDQVRLDRRK